MEYKGMTISMVINGIGDAVFKIDVKDYEISIHYDTRRTGKVTFIGDCRIYHREGNNEVTRDVLGVDFFYLEDLDELINVVHMIKEKFYR